MSSLINPSYSHLADLLAMGKWQEADQATAQLMLKIAEKEETGWLDRQSIEKFPCDHLLHIDRLWLENSHGHFGLSIQAKILAECGIKYQEFNYPSLCKLGDHLGWRKSWWDKKWLEPRQIIFNLKAPPGHLPIIWLWWDVVGDLQVWNISLQLIHRMRNCY